MKYGKVGSPDNIVTARDIIIATGSVPFVPKGIEVDGRYDLSFFPLSCYDYTFFIESFDQRYFWN